MNKPKRHPIESRTSLYVVIPFYLAEELGINRKSEIEYEKSDGDLLVRVKGVRND